MESKIEGPALLGFTDYFADSAGGHFDDPVVGAKKPAAKPAAKPVAKPAAKGTIKVKKAPKSRVVSPHKRALVSAVNAGQKALSVSKTAKDKAVSHATALQAGKHAPLVPIATKVRGGQIVLGVAPAVARILSPAARAAVQKHVNAAAKLTLTSRRLAVSAAKAAKAGKVALDFVKKSTPYLKLKLQGPTPPTKMHGGIAEHDVIGAVLSLDDESLLGLMEILGVDAQGLAPGQSGYDPTTDPSDPNYVAPTVDPNAPLSNTDPFTSGSGVVTAPDGTVLYDPSTDPGIVAIPQRGGTLSSADAEVAWQSVPDDGIVYDGAAKGWPRYSVGSKGYFDATGGKGEATTAYPDATGFIWGWDHMNAPNSAEPARWIKREGVRGISAHGAGDVVLNILTAGVYSLAQKDNLNWADTAQGVDPINPPAQESGAAGYGPLIGNPSGPLVSLQYAIADKKWFWQSANAPSWACAEADSKITEANAKTIAANTAAAAAQAAQMAQDQAAQAEAQAKQDASDALAQQQQDAAQAAADAAAQVADTAAQQQETAQQAQLDIQQQQANIEQAKQEAQTQAAAQNAIIEQANVWNTWAKDHPEEAAAQMQAEQAAAEQAAAEQVADEGAADEDTGDEGDEGDTGDEGEADDSSSDDGEE